MPGLAYHVGHVLECGALACDPGSPSDCLVAEIYDDGSAIFTAPNPARRCTAYSIAAHSLYEESHPQLQYYPEGILVDGEDAVLLPGRSQCRHPQQPLRPFRKAMAVEHQARRIAPAWLPQGIADPSRSRRPSEDSVGRAGLWPQRRAGAARRCVAARTGHHRRGDRQDPGGRGPARKPADALPHSLRLCRAERRPPAISPIRCRPTSSASRARTVRSAPSCRAERAIPCSSRTMPRSRPPC